MEVDQAGVWMPGGDSPGHATIVERSGASKPMGQFLLGTDVVPGKHLQASETSEQCVLRCPATDSAQLAQLLSNHVVRLSGQRLEVQFLPGDRSGEIEKRTRFLAAETDRAQFFGHHLNYFVRLRKGVTEIRRRFK